MKAVKTIISKGLYDEIVREKRRLIEYEANKCKSRRRRINFTIACQSLLRKIK